MSDLRWLEGTVVSGAGRGTKLGFPTANIELLHSTDLPTAGIYAGWVYFIKEVDKMAAAIHVGPRPTFNDSTPVLEVHILDFSPRSLLNRNINVQLVKKIREVNKFDSPDALIAAIETDCAQVRSILAYSMAERRA